MKGLVPGENRGAEHRSQPHDNQDTRRETVEVSGTVRRWRGGRVFLDVDRFQDRRVELGMNSRVPPDAIVADEDSGGYIEIVGLDIYSVCADEVSRRADLPVSRVVDASADLPAGDSARGLGSPDTSLRIAGGQTYTFTGTVEPSVVAGETAPVVSALSLKPSTITLPGVEDREQLVNARFLPFELSAAALAVPGDDFPRTCPTATQTCCRTRTFASCIARLRPLVSVQSSRAWTDAAWAT